MKKTFGWHIRQDNHGNASFDDGEATVKAIAANGGTIVQPIGKDFPEITATFTDPAGNLWSIYQHRE
ncbi:VOC family protein [Mucilaginibacter dorajii]|uniref:Glyoxalase/fosfomycin resistance/dioxygenase domain-containing protein n=1 Tax=Mucilaginibacter dorajii TaxID=692994 RepID=A0ABP7PVQ2_9SPHI|nr:VOC family protein [Mucilaginibacter dorajii]MCS3734975.1 hypothetical protein [Mucilaginibacter dorajii]